MPGAVDHGDVAEDVERRTPARLGGSLELPEREGAIVGAANGENATSKANFDENVLRPENEVAVEVTANLVDFSGLDKGENRPRECVVREDHEGQTFARLGGSLALPEGGVPFVLTEKDAVTNVPNDIEAPS
jgi:hypothetical protein